MFLADNWKDFEIIDTSSGEKLERWGKYILIRPDPQVIWNTTKGKIWNTADARYIRSNKGGGYWENCNLPDVWSISYKDLKFNLKPMGFKHTGLFPEQAVNWDFMRNKIKGKDNIKALNLFAYTGGATLALAKEGAFVCHVDASKGMVQWAKENAKISGLENAPIRYIVDDCMKFVQREIRRGNKYDAIVLDPPSYGRGPGGEVWKLEDKLYDFLVSLTEVLSDNPLFVVLNSYTTGLSPTVMKYLLSQTVGKKFKGSIEADEIGIAVKETGEILPCGNTARWCCK